MPARAALDPDLQLTIEEFLDFNESRPREEKWELIEGEPVMSPSAVDFHQIVVANVISHFWNAKRAQGASWYVLAGTGTRSPESARSLLQPDVMVKEFPPIGSPVSDDCRVAVEILSPSNRKADQIWRQKFYRGVPNCAHYVTVSLKTRQVTTFHRAVAWAPEVLTALDDTVRLPGIGVDLALADIYRDTPQGV